MRRESRKHERRKHEKGSAGRGYRQVLCDSSFLVFLSCFRLSAFRDSVFVFSIDACRTTSANTLIDISMKFILIWNDEHDRERNVRWLADSLEDTVRGVQALLDDARCYDEDRAVQQFHEDSLKLAFQSFLDEVASDDLAAFLTGMGIGESAELPCAGGSFEIFRDH